MILFFLRWILDTSAKNSQEEHLEAKVEEPRKRKSRKGKKPGGRHKAIVASESIIEITDNLDTPSDSLSQTSKAVTPALLF